MKMIEAMTGAADAQDEVVEQPYEKSGAFIGGLIPAPINPTMTSHVRGSLHGAGYRKLPRRE